MTASRFVPAPGSMEPLFVEPGDPLPAPVQPPIADPNGYKLPDGDRPVPIQTRAYHLGKLVEEVSGSNSRYSFVDIAYQPKHYAKMSERYGVDLPQVVDSAGANALHLGGLAARSFVSAYYGTELRPRSVELREAAGLDFADFLAAYGQPGQAPARRRFLTQVQRSARIIKDERASKKVA